MKHLVIGQLQKTNFSAFHWSPHCSLVFIGQYFVTMRVVHLPKRCWNQFNYRIGPKRSLSQNRTRLCGTCIAATAGFHDCLGLQSLQKTFSLQSDNKLIDDLVALKDCCKSKNQSYHTIGEWLWIALGNVEPFRLRQSFASGRCWKNGPVIQRQKC